MTADPDFQAWVQSLPADHWSRYDLSACRLGWDAAFDHVFSDSEPVSQATLAHNVVGFCLILAGLLALLIAWTALFLVMGL